MSPVTSSGVVRLVPAQPSAREQMADVVELGRAAASGDASAVERLAVLADLLAHRITTDRATAVVSDHYEMRPSGRLVPVPSVVIEGTPLAQQDFAAHVGHDFGRGERVRAAAASERRRVEALAEMRDEHESLSARRARVAAAEALIDRIFPDPTIPKGER